VAVVQYTFTHRQYTEQHNEKDHPTWNTTIRIHNITIRIHNIAIRIHNIAIRIHKKEYIIYKINPLNAELNPICYLLTLLGAHPIFHISRIKG
jgi:hypothetical protein